MARFDINAARRSCENRDVPVSRLLSLDDAAVLTELVQRNREYLAPWEPVRDDGFYTAEGQRGRVEELLDRYDHGLALPLVILDQRQHVVGRITLDNIVRGAFPSASFGYWVDEAHTRRGLATAAVGEMVARAFNDLALHRVEAGTVLHNLASQRALERNGFIRLGVAPAYLKIAGTCQDHALYQRINPDAGT
jgi:[ribosomal protein S5]-alanine N-acetyltransferase